jgi:hypothetical protein
MVNFTPPNLTINEAACQETLKRLKEAFWCTRLRLLTKSVLLSHDNTGLHSAAITVCLLNSWSWEILPDLAPSETHLFSKMRKHLRGQYFHYSEDVQNKVKKMVTCPGSIFFLYEQIDVSL